MSGVLLGYLIVNHDLDLYPLISILNIYYGYKNKTKYTNTPNPGTRGKAS